MKDIPSMFGINVFGDKVMRERLPKEVYKSLKTTIAEDKPLDQEVANIIANAMKDWAIENGATHFTHWFQPMTGITAEKHDAFISPSSDGGIIMEFSGKNLVKGESDASSFPSGGLRATFEARGYTAWDPTYYAFIKDGVLCIPTVFCSYTGDALDKKTPLLRSMEAINKQAKRILKLFGKTDVKKVTPTVGAEQEYFLIDKKMFQQRPDLLYTGRTLLGARTPKGQEMDDHYFGVIKPRVATFMAELDEALWKLGVFAKTRHNEAAPAQHELAPIFTSTNTATDHNQLVMEMMKKVASKHGLTCLLHEKPFAGVNGSGKHNNWSLSTDTGLNLLDPGDSPYDNAQFLLFLCAVIKAVDEHQDLLRISVASAGNDHRLGANEAPPAIVSMFLGDELNGILDAIAEDRSYSKRAQCEVNIGVKALPHLPQDTSDRNRTSPFAFTGNKFEFRMPGSSFSIASINAIINTIVANSLCEFADKLESASDFTVTIKEIIKETIIKHKRIIFNGNNYSAEWKIEAERRGLLNLVSTVDTFPYLIAKKNVEMFKKFKVFSETELQSRYEMHIENYCKIMHIECVTMVDMMHKFVMPSVNAYLKDLTKTALQIKDLGINPSVALIDKLNKLYILAEERLVLLEDAIVETEGFGETMEGAECYRDKVIPAMQAVRVVADEMELLTAKKYLALPSYDDLLFGVY